MKKLMIVGAGRLGHEVAEWLSKHQPVVIADHLQSGFLHPDHAEPATECLITVADPRTRKVIADALLSKNPLLKFITAIHWSADTTTASIGGGCILCQNSVVSISALLGAHIIINMGTTIGHDVQIGSFTTISSHVDVCGRAKIGEGVFIGSSAVVLPGIKIGDGATIGAGAIVTADVLDGATVFGNPARRVK